MFSCALTSNISQPACFIIMNQWATLSVGECMKNNECLANFHRLMKQCLILQMFWDGENRLRINFLDVTHPQAACSLFKHIKARLHATCRALTPTISKFSYIPLCAQSTCQNDMCVCAITVLYVQGEIMGVQRAYCTGNRIYIPLGA